MEQFLLFFEQMPSWQKVTWVFTCLSFAFVLEAIVPLAKMEYKKLRHLGVNLFFLSIVFVVNFIFSKLTVKVTAWTGSEKIGLLHMIDLPIWVELLIAFLVLDLVAQYFVHFLLHKVTFMWKLHMVHHSDTHVDASTGTRHHPFDYVFREIFALAAIVFTGAPLAFYLFYRISTVFFTYMSHANISLPLWLDKGISFVFISPNMHKFHHHVERPWTDSNYGNVFSIWDRIFGTYVYGDPKQIEYGLDVVDNSRDEDIMYQLTLPINKDIKTDRGFF